MINVESDYNPLVVPPGGEPGTRSSIADAGRIIPAVLYLIIGSEGVCAFIVVVSCHVHKPRLQISTLYRVKPVLLHLKQMSDLCCT